ncbi:hypothetical protein B484DRAFT_407118 [Ochromonadaceae sp. CCMP2298]|nr:hypothetical protein B484DRAFT_407118 [Ochromonadaceae sp. CCMP2298]
MRAEVRSIEDRIKLIKKGKGADGPIIEVRMDDDWQAAEAARVEKLRRSRGQECDYALTYSENMPLIKDVTCVAIGEGGYIALLEDGSAHYDHLPPEVLLTKLVYFVLGPPGTFYAQFDNGKAAWGQVSSRVEELFLSKEVVCAWLGEKGSYFVGWEEEGVYKTEHQHLPHEMMRRYAVDAGARD